MAKASVNSPSGPASVETLTTRGRKTRDALLDAARTVFEDVGFPEARVELITAAAQVSYGTFYRYFESKEDVFRVLSDQLFEDIHHRGPSDSTLSPAQRLIAANRTYYQAYRRNARLMAIVEQVATFNDDFRRLRHDHRHQLIDRQARAIARWQQEGLVRQSLDPEMAARAMSAMVDHTLYLWLVQGDEANEALLLDTLDQMCLGALGLDQD
ncbi:TetR/AcrR family transcriptional regulator [Nocardia sp. 348MFTsu5.1]|uniref:TetR/AcrR family transcriptional regulator n=1 Tax=Nocardia sp. 348MFTsu5.1 TaxID=1172185 RepID=UPI00055A8740|nr:TetR/AcrR family transcriptional regulator [Nocardia sp. 348MFTsu5.1]